MAQGIKSNSGLRDWRSRQQPSQANGVTQRRKSDEEQWKNLLAMINQTTPQTMAGYGLGKLLKKGWKLWEDNYNKEKIDQAYGGQGNGAETALKEADVRNLAVDDSKPAYYGIAPTTGMLGDGFALGSTQTKHTVEDAAGNKETTTTNTPMIQGRPGLSLNEMAQQVMGTPEMMANGNLMDMLRKQNAYYGY